MIILSFNDYKRFQKKKKGGERGLPPMISSTNFKQFKIWERRIFVPVGRWIDDLSKKK
jgi:hypothetical protein